MVEVYEKLEKISGRLEMTSIVSDFLKQVPKEDLEVVIPFLMGRVFPGWSEKELGVANKLIVKVISRVSGVAEVKVLDKIRETGDSGLATQQLFEKKVQSTLLAGEKLTLKKVYQNLEKLTKVEGKGSQEKRFAYISELFSLADSLEGKYIVRLILEELRLGVGRGTLRDAIAEAYGVESKEVERAFNLCTDLGKVAKIAKEKGDEGLRKVGIEPGRPMEVMLAQKLESLEEGFAKMETLALEIKYDGARIQIHKDNGEIKLFTRRLEDVTKQFPEIVKAAKEGIKATSAIVEGELVAINSFQDRHPRPFQDLSRRIKRKYDIEEIARKIPVEINLFDLVFLEGKNLLEVPFSERRKKLEGLVEESKNFLVAKELVTKDAKEASKFYEEALKLGHEGVMIKNLDAPYQPGSRVGYMYKVKPVMETLDVVIIGATWGEGRRANWLASFLLAVLDEDTGKPLTIGRMGTGFTDEEFKEMTTMLKEDITEEIGKEVKLKPRVVTEVAYEEIQKSPNYESGYALRFPRLVRIREDKGFKDADTVERVEEILGGGK